MHDIKDYLGKELNKFVLANIIIILIISGQLDALSDAKSISVFGISLANISIIASPIYIYVFILNYIYSSLQKDVLVFWWNDMPGYRIFSDIKNCRIRDPRFTRNDVLEKYSNIYKALANLDDVDKNIVRTYENASWYKIYQKYNKEESVKDALRGQLLCRDACVTSFNMLMLLGVIYILGYGYLFKYISFIFLLSVYIISNFAARNRAERLVLNVIALDIAKAKNEVEVEKSE